MFVDVSKVPTSVNTGENINVYIQFYEAKPAGHSHLMLRINQDVAVASPVSARAEVRQVRKTVMSHVTVIYRSCLQLEPSLLPIFLHPPL